MYLTYLTNYVEIVKSILKFVYILNKFRQSTDFRVPEPGRSCVGVGGFLRADFNGTAWNFGSLAGISSTRVVSIFGSGRVKRKLKPSSSSSSSSHGDSSRYSSPSSHSKPIDQERKLSRIGKHV